MARKRVWILKVKISEHSVVSLELLPINLLDASATSTVFKDYFLFFINFDISYKPNSNSKYM